jgi:hypothetical protein
MLTGLLGSATFPGPSFAAAAKAKLSTYTNEQFGISIRYPGNYSVLEGNQIPKQWSNEVPIETGFVGHGGITIAALVPPGEIDHENDNRADELLLLSVNSKLTSADCYKFTSDDPDIPPLPKKRIGTMEFARSDDMQGGMCHDIYLKNFHIFRNRVCYEIQMGVYGSPCIQSKENDVEGGIENEFRELKKSLATLTIRER